MILKPWSRNFILSDLKLATPQGYYGRVVGRCGIAKKYGVLVHNETTDLEYRGLVGVILFNFSNEEYVSKRGDCIAQMIIERYFTLKFVNLPTRTLKEGRVGSILQVFNFLFSFFKKFSKKWNQSIQKLCSFEKKLYHYESVEDLHCSQQLPLLIL